MEFLMSTKCTKIMFPLQLNEMTADLAEEHSTATLATERLENEQSDRLKLEKEKADLLVKIKLWKTPEIRD